MTNILIKHGHHYHQFPPFTTLPWVGNPSITRVVTFDASCQYDSAAYNADDVNKLFGLSFGFGGVHHNSARFGWRWNKEGSCIDLVAYCYVNGQRNWDEQMRFPVVAQVKPGEPLLLEIEYESDGYTFFVYSANKDNGAFGGFIGCRSVNANVPHDLPHHGLTHGPYFGGTLTAPHDMRLQLSRA